MTGSVISVNEIGEFLSLVSTVSVHGEEAICLHITVLELQNFGIFEKLASDEFLKLSRPDLFKTCRPAMWTPCRLEPWFSHLPLSLGSASSAYGLRANILTWKHRQSLKTDFLDLASLRSLVLLWIKDRTGQRLWVLTILWLMMPLSLFLDSAFCSSVVYLSLPVFSLSCFRTLISILMTKFLYHRS